MQQFKESNATERLDSVTAWLPAECNRRDMLTAGVQVASLLVRRGANVLKLPNQDWIESLRGGLSGQVLVPGDPGYEAARRPVSFNPITDKRPSVIVRCATRNDVAHALRFAREQSLAVAVRSGGHDVLGACVCDGMVIDLSLLRNISIDAERQTAHVEPGVLSGELNAIGRRSGVAAALGCHPGVGVAGLTLGGGLGWLLGKYGAACDHLIGADLITADGKLMRASETENPDLLWALRGGGGNFGVVTALDFQLHPLNQVLGGILALRADIARFLSFYSSFMEAAPDELTAELTAVGGKSPVIIAIVCWSGEGGLGERVLKPLRSFATPLADWIDRVPYAHLTSRMREVSSLLRSPRPEGRAPEFGYWKGGSVQHLTPQCTEQIAAVLDRAPTGCSVGLGHYMHGQICRVARHATPLIRTAGQMTYFLSASWASAELADTRMQWVNQSFAALHPFSVTGGYINYLSTDDQSDVKAAYRDNYKRLAQLKNRYDPSNVFHCNRNIRATSNIAVS